MFGLQDLDFLEHRVSAISITRRRWMQYWPTNAWAACRSFRVSWEW
jgi:hypothetical protein